jgi:hypothetical protein
MILPSQPIDIQADRYSSRSLFKPIIERLACERLACTELLPATATRNNWTII